MQTFFHGWRRKAGVVTLVMSMALMAGWIRSYTVADWISLADNQHYVVALSMHGEISWMRGSFGILGSQPTVPGLQFSTGPVIEANKYQNAIWYWPVVIPLTLLSAYLILWKPKKRACPN